MVGVADADYVHTHRWANYFADRGHDVHLVSFMPVSPRSREALHSAVSVIDWVIPHFHLKRFWITVAAVSRLRHILGDLAPHLVHAHLLSYSAWYAALASRYPLVLSVMGGDIDGTAWRPGSRREQVMTPYTLRRTDLVVCWSSNLQRIVKPMLRSGVRCELVVGGVDFRVFRRRTDSLHLRRSLGLGADDFVIFSPRLFRPGFNIEAIVHAFSRVLKCVPQARLLLVKHGAESYPDFDMGVEHLIDRLSIRRRVRIVPTIPSADMPLYYSAVDCTVSVPNTDGTPMTVMESAACGTPVLIQDLPTYDPTIFVPDQTVIMVPPRDPEALARGITRLASDPSLRERLKIHGERMAVRHGDINVEMKRLERMYLDLIPEPREERS